MEQDLTQQTVTIISSKDGSSQSALWYVPPGARPDQSGDLVPLLVTLHTWSNGYDQCQAYLPYARDRRWAMVAPDFRGPNNRPEACASDLAVQDVLDAVAYAQQHSRVDRTRIYLVGGSGGGHMALMMAARAPNLWAGVSSWVPISDLAAWHARHDGKRYAKMTENCCGGPPGRPETDPQYRARSPLYFLEAARGLALDINAGIHDGHRGSVPISHSLRAFNVVARANGHPEKQLSDEQIAILTDRETVPADLAGESEPDPERQRTVLFRRAAGPVRITIFEGEHEEETPAALLWLARQRQGGPAVFEVPADQPISPGGAEPDAHPVGH